MISLFMLKVLTLISLDYDLFVKMLPNLSQEEMVILLMQMTSF